MRRVVVVEKSEATTFTFNLFAWDCALCVFNRPDGEMNNIMSGWTALPWSLAGSLFGLVEPRLAQQHAGHVCVFVYEGCRLQ